MFICCCQSFLVAAVGLWFVGLLLAVHGVAAGVVDVVVQCSDECGVALGLVAGGAEGVASSRMTAVREVLRMLMVLFMFIFVFINCLYIIQYIGLTHHKRRPPSASFRMSRRILS